MLGSDTPGVALMVDCSAFMDRDIVYLGSSVLGLTSRLSLALDFLIATKLEYIMAYIKHRRRRRKTAV